MANTDDKKSRGSDYNSFEIHDVLLSRNIS